MVLPFSKLFSFFIYDKLMQFNKAVSDNGDFAIKICVFHKVKTAQKRLLKNPAAFFISTLKFTNLFLPIWWQSRAIIFKTWINFMTLFLLWYTLLPISLPCLQRAIWVSSQHICLLNLDLYETLNLCSCATNQ